VKRKKPAPTRNLNKRAAASSARKRQRSPADLEPLLRKGQFLRRMFARPRGPLVDESGNPTSLALSVRRWGEAVPKTAADARRLGEKGRKILEQYHVAKAEQQLRRAA
jgi:hypothetical protein